MAKKERYVVEGVWSGYVSAQSRVVHRTVETRDFAEKVMALGSILYTDGTSLWLSAKPIPKGERVKESNQYGSLIRDCVQQGVNRVSELAR